MESKNTIKVSEKCAAGIEQINTDGGKLYYFFKGVFKSLGETNNPSHRPSDIFLFFSTNESGINESTQPCYMTATEYLQLIINPNLDQFDKAFIQEYEKTKDVKQSWKFFAKHFKEKGIQTPFAEYKKQMIKNDQKRLDLANQGIYLSDDGKTIII